MTNTTERSCLEPILENNQQKSRIIIFHPIFQHDAADTETHPSVTVPEVTCQACGRARNGFQVSPKMTASCHWQNLHSLTHSQSCVYSANLLHKCRTESGPTAQNPVSLPFFFLSLSKRQGSHLHENMWTKLVETRKSREQVIGWRVLLYRAPFAVLRYLGQNNGADKQLCLTA